MRITITIITRLLSGAFPFIVYLSRMLLKMSVESPGRKAVVQCTSDLTSLLKHNLSCSGKLLEKGLITEAVHNWVLTAQGVSTQEKAARLVSCLADRVGTSSQVFDELVQALKEIDPFCGDIVDKLTSLHSTSTHAWIIVYSLFPLHSFAITLMFIGSFIALRITIEEKKKQGNPDHILISPLNNF